VRSIALNGLDEIGDEVVSSLQLNVDVSPGVSGPVSERDKIVVSENAPHDKGSKNQKKYTH